VIWLGAFRHQGGRASGPRQRTPRQPRERLSARRRGQGRGVPDGRGGARARIEICLGISPAAGWTLRN
jgi:hypothetical protein